ILVAAIERKMPAELILHRLRTTEVDVEPDVRLIVLGPETEESDPPQDATVATVVKAARTKKATLIGVRFMSGSCPAKESKPKPATHQWRPRSDRTSGAMTSEPEPPSRSDPPSAPSAFEAIDSTASGFRPKSGLGVK